MTPGQGNSPHVYCISIRVSFNKNVTITAERLVSDLRPIIRQFTLPAFVAYVCQNMLAVSTSGLIPAVKEGSE